MTLTEHVNVYDALRSNKNLMKMNRCELEKFVEYGQRPVYGIPHINYGQKSPKTFEDFERKNIMNWKKFSHSVLKEKPGEQEVTKILDAHFQ